jgi:hypothetical protein
MTERYEVEMVGGKWGIRDTVADEFDPIVCACGYLASDGRFAARHRRRPECSDDEDALYQAAERVAAVLNGED